MTTRPDPLARAEQGFLRKVEAMEKIKKAAAARADAAYDRKWATALAAVAHAKPSTLDHAKVVFERRVAVASKVRNAANARAGAIWWRKWRAAQAARNHTLAGGKR
jgi:hypothetical protein